MTPAEIGNLGERYATKWLESNGYSCYRNTQQPGSTDIEARGSSKNILVSHLQNSSGERDFSS